MLDRKPDSPFPGLVDRFVTYAKIHTQSDESSETYPSTERQFDLAKLLVDELKAVGLADAAVDDNCYVTATLPASPGCEKVPAIAFISHMDTYPEVSGENVVPTFHENYQGGDIPLPQNGIVIKHSENPYLDTCIGEQGTGATVLHDVSDLGRAQPGVDRRETHARAQRREVGDDELLRRRAAVAVTGTGRVCAGLCHTEGGHGVHHLL
mgnify:CR=1 FL=1